MHQIRFTAQLIDRYAAYLQEAERAPATVQKYIHDIRTFQNFLGNTPITKSALIRWKHNLTDTHAPSSVNTMLAAVNGFLAFLDRRDLTVKPLKIQKTLFVDERKELSKRDYAHLVQAAEFRENERLSLVMQTICSTGIRVSELKYITVEAVHSGRAEIRNKGKLRVVFLPHKLCKILQKYLRKQKKTVGAVFTTRTGRPLDRSNIWRDMKMLCESAGVDSSKVFPHNLRHLFARTYYSLQKDMTKLADILGHSNINTTRIYTAESGNAYVQQLGRLSLVIT